MSTTANALYLPANGHLVALDLLPDTALLPTVILGYDSQIRAK